MREITEDTNKTLVKMTQALIEYAWQYGIKIKVNITWPRKPKVNRMVKLTMLRTPK